MLGLLATMWLRPGVAQELIELATTEIVGRLRAQSPDPATSTPVGNRYQNFTPPVESPYDAAGNPLTQPVPVSRPTSWPGTPVNTPPATAGAVPSANYPSMPTAQPGFTQTPGAAPQVANVANAGSPQPDFGTGNLQVLPSQPQDLVEAQIVAKVGTEVILASDIYAQIAEYVYTNKISIPPGQEKAAYEMMFRPMLRQAIETKLVYNDAIHTLPKENLPKIETSMNEAFDKEQLPKLFEMHKVSNKHELDQKLRERGTTLERARRSFFEKSLSQVWVREHMKNNDEIPISDVLGDYRANLADYEYPAKARWEELMVRFDRFPDRATAWAALAEMGNAVWNGAPLEQVAKAKSQGVTASDGGAHDWTSKGSLKAKAIDEALFSLPVGKLSQPIETENGFHIVRVVERKEAGRIDFVEAQPEIKKKLKEAKFKRQLDDFLESVRQRTPVWTIYDNEPGGLDGKGNS